MTPQLWAGEKESTGRASIYRGPILLAFDPRFNPGVAEDPPALTSPDPSAWPAPSRKGPHPDPAGRGEDGLRARRSLRLCQRGSRRVPLSLLAEGQWSRGRRVQPRAPVAKPPDRVESLM